MRILLWARITYVSIHNDTHEQYELEQTHTQAQHNEFVSSLFYGRENVRFLLLRHSTRNRHSHRPHRISHLFLCAFYTIFFCFVSSLFVEGFHSFRCDCGELWNVHMCDDTLLFYFNRKKKNRFLLSATPIKSLTYPDVDVRFFLFFKNIIPLSAWETTNKTMKTDRTPTHTHIFLDAIISVLRLMISAGLYSYPIHPLRLGRSVNAIVTILLNRAAYRWDIDDFIILFFYHFCCCRRIVGMSVANTWEHTKYADHRHNFNKMFEWTMWFMISRCSIFHSTLYAQHTAHT